MDDRKVVGRDIQKVEFGWPLGMPYCRGLGNGLWEVRSGLADSRIGRVIFCVARERMVLLHGFVKKTQKTPARDLKLALKRMTEVLKMTNKKRRVRWVHPLMPFWPNRASWKSARNKPSSRSLRRPDKGHL